MAIQYEDYLKKQLASNTALPAYILFGDDGFLKKNYMGKISKLTADSDDIFDYAKFSADCDLQEVYDALAQLPVSADKKLVILCDYDFEHCSKSDSDKLNSLLSDTYDTSVFVLLLDSFEFDAKKSAKFKKLVSSVEKGNGAAVQLNHRRQPELVKLLCDGALKRGCKFEAIAARYLVETAGDDINTLQNELEKLCGFVNGGTITKEIVDEVCIKTPEASVYNLSKQIMAANTEGALKTLDDLFFMRIEPMIILYTVSSSYVDIFRVYACRTKGKSYSEAAKLYGYKGREFVLERAAQNLVKFDFNKLNLSFDALIKADKALKSFSADPKTVLEQLTVRLIYIISKGEAVDKA